MKDYTILLKTIISLLVMAKPLLNWANPIGLLLIGVLPSASKDNKPLLGL
jgi:hypothetical protein